MNTQEEPPCIISYCFRDSSGKEIATKNEKIPLVPASNMKIVTGYVAYALMGMKHRIKASFQLKDNELVIRGGPTPLMDHNALSVIASLLREKSGHVRKGKLRVFLKNPSLDGQTVNPYWIYGDSKFSYQPKITNFSLDENCKPSGSGLAFSFTEIHEREDDFLPIRNPNLYLRQEISRALEDERDLEGVTDNYIDDDSIVFQQTVEDIIEHLEPVSCNFSAEVLFKYVTHFITGRRGSWKESSQLVMDELTRFLGYRPTVKIVDGSGISRHNLLTTGFLSDLLQRAHNKGDNQFIMHFPSPGSGTLKKRLLKHKSEGIYAKTGTLNGVAALSGYIYSRDISFSIIVNNYLGEGKASTVIDEILDSFLTGNELPPQK